jgi:membrane-associated phospholipid phosphatase
VKVRSFFLPRLVMASAAQGRTILCGFWYLISKGRLGGPLPAILAIGLAWLLFPRDEALLAEIHRWPGPQDALAERIAWLLGKGGDYPTYNLPLALVFWFYGVWKKSSGWRRIAVICFLGATLAGGLDDCLRLTLGRPRPDAHMPDGFYGLPAAFYGRFESFPSGHAAAVFGTAMALIVTDFWLGVAATVFALAVIWARLELYRHYPSDVAVGSIIGICMGLLVGLGAKTHWRPWTRRAPLPSIPVPPPEKLQALGK